ncbi:hypothetical protein CL634_09855 [bacterium]|nr:hypothetical protein [bacterium]|tara:strand:+ start:751 stop:1224 length:474 start_codon:yes stop_codon:yes gene_type:complete
MSRNFESKFNNIDALLSEVEQSTDGKKIFADIDDICSEIDTGIERRKADIESWPKEQKRKEAVDSEDTFVLNLLSMDEDFNIRTLSACNPNIPNNSLKRLAESANDYIKMVIANNLNVAHDILDRLAEVTDEQEVLDAVMSNPNVSKVTKYKIENKM